MDTSTVKNGSDISSKNGATVNSLVNNNEENFKKSEEQSWWARVLTKKRKVLGIEFAPLLIPWERRMETAAALTWVCLFYSTAVFGWPIMLYITFCTPFILFGLAYFAWIHYDKDICEQGGRASDWTRRWKLWVYYKNYFPINLIVSEPLDATKNYLFCSHPHGILSSGVFTCFGTEAVNISKIFPHHSAHILTLPMNFKTPFFREFLLAFGACSASKKSMNYLLSYPGGGKIALLVPGGASEALDSHPGTHIVQLKEKKGFIKVALQNGCELVPLFSFGETDIYDQVKNPPGSFIRKLQDRFRSSFSFSPVFFTGRGIFQYSFGVLPLRRPINVVVGTPIHVEKKENPTIEDINDLHKKYVDALVHLFESHKQQYASDPSKDLTIV